jgi:hypothetical protein
VWLNPLDEGIESYLSSGKRRFAAQRSRTLRSITETYARTRRGRMLGCQANVVTGCFIVFARVERAVPIRRMTPLRITRTRG